ncbi:MAG: hypothetical protein ACJ8LG_08945 [Massilia sp.]
MATNNEDKAAEGRKYEQLTRDGTSSAGTMGSGATGEPGNMQGGQGGPAGRTDDLLAGGAAGQDSQGFGSGDRTAELQTGMGDVGSLGKGGAGNQQREGEQQPGGDTGAMRSVKAEQGPAGVPESGGQRIGQKRERDA